MSPRSFAVLLLATIASIGLAAWAVSERDVPLATASRPEPMFEGLLGKLNDVATIRITSAGKTTTLEKGEGSTWKIAEHGGYPADPDQVRELALTFANLQLVEPKTSNPERLDRLELSDPKAADAKSREIALLAKDGTPLADAVIGKTRFGLYGGGRAGVYVRRASEEQAWLAAGELTVPATPMDLVKKELINISSDDVARVTLAAQGPTPLVISKPGKAAEEFTLQATAPEGRSIDPDKLDRVAGALSSLTMQDVRPAAELAPAPDAPKAVYEGWNGLRVEITLVPVEGSGEAWAIFDVTSGPALQPAAPAEAAAPPTDAKPEEPSAGEQATKLDASLNGWAFRLPEFAASRLTWKIEDLLKSQGTS
jgi:hypothetical protein